MVGYTLAVGTRDPVAVEGASDSDAVRAAVALIHRDYGADLAQNPQEVATLIGPTGLVTRPSERLDEFIHRVTPLGDGDVVQPGDSNTPDCNGD